MLRLLLSKRKQRQAGVCRAAEPSGVDMLTVRGRGIRRRRQHALLIKNANVQAHLEQGALKIERLQEVRAPISRHRIRIYTGMHGNCLPAGRAPFENSVACSDLRQTALLASAGLQTACCPLRSGFPSLARPALGPGLPRERAAASSPRAGVPQQNEAQKLAAAVAPLPASTRLTTLETQLLQARTVRPPIAEDILSSKVKRLWPHPRAWGRWNPLVACAERVAHVDFSVASATEEGSVILAINLCSVLLAKSADVIAFVPARERVVGVHVDVAGLA